MAERALRVGVAGAGHFGRFHALKLAAGTRMMLAGVHDPDAGRAEVLAAEVGVPALGFEALLADCDAVVVASPAATHHAVAGAALRAGRHVLVEKPIAATLDEADELAGLARARGLVLQVGHLLRYSPERAAIAARMTRPAYIECVRIAPFKPRGTDVSVVLDLMVHDLDLVLSLVESPVESVDAVGVAVAGPQPDIANARLRFANGCVATLVASRVSLRTERRMRLFGQEGYIAVDFAERKLTMIGRSGDVAVPMIPQGRMQTATWEAVDLLEAEHASFAAAVLDGAPVLVDAAAGRRALAAALAIEASLAASLGRAVAGGLILPD